jgi:DNA-binding transcriptional LysR family regulator
MDFSDLATFVAAARAGSFAGAARVLGISPAMVGRRIQALEEQYAARLIERTTRTQKLTETGERFLEHAAALLEAAEELSELTRPSGGQLSGRIRLSAPTTLGIKRLPGIIAAFSAEHPQVTFEMKLTDRRVDLVSEGYDLAVRIGQLAGASLIVRRVGTYRFVCCASPSYLGRHGAPTGLTDLRQARCILNLNLRPRNRWPFEDENGRIFKVTVNGAVEIDNGEAQREAALGGAGIVYLPLDLVGDDIAAGRLVQVLQDWRTVSLPIQTVHASRSLVPARVGRFIEAIAKGLRD